MPLGEKMPIATVDEFVIRGIIPPIKDAFITLYGLLELNTAHMAPNHPNIIYSSVSALAWIAKFLGVIIRETASNSTLVTTFNDTLHTLSFKSNTFFGNYSGKSGMSYIAKHAYMVLQNNKTLAIDLSEKFMRAVNSSVIYVLKAFEML